MFRAKRGAQESAEKKSTSGSPESQQSGRSPVNTQRLGRRDRVAGVGADVS